MWGIPGAQHAGEGQSSRGIAQESPAKPRGMLPPPLAPRAGGAELTAQPLPYLLDGIEFRGCSVKILNLIYKPPPRPRSRGAARGELGSPSRICSSRHRWGLTKGLLRLWRTGITASLIQATAVPQLLLPQWHLHPWQQYRHMGWVCPGPHCGNSWQQVQQEKFRKQPRPRASLVKVLEVATLRCCPQGASGTVLGSQGPLPNTQAEDVSPQVPLPILMQHQ